MSVEHIVLRGGSRDGQRLDDAAHPDTLFRIDDAATGEVYARVDDGQLDDGSTLAVFRLDADGQLVREAQRRFAPATT